MNKTVFNKLMKVITYIVSLNSFTSVICLLLFLFHSSCGRVYFPFKLESVSRSERDAAQTKPKKSGVNCVARVRDTRLNGEHDNLS